MPPFQRANISIHIVLFQNRKKNTSVIETTIEQSAVGKYEIPGAFKLPDCFADSVYLLPVDTESSSDVKYYDDKPQFAVDSVGADTVTCECSAVPLEVIARLTGQNYDEETKMLLESSTAKKPYFAIGYITSDTNGDDVYVWRYKCKVASIPSEEHKTKDASTDSNGQQLVFTCFETVHKSELTGESFKSVVHKADNIISEEEFFRTVMTPDLIAAKYKPALVSEV